MKALSVVAVLFWTCDLFFPAFSLSAPPADLTLVACAADQSALPPYYHVLQKYLSAALHIRVELVSHPDIEGVASAFQKGAGDLFIGDLRDAVAVTAATSGNMVLKRQTPQKEERREVLVAGEGGGATLKGYQGGVIGLRDETSIDHFYLARALMSKAGIFLEKKEGLPSAHSAARGPRMSYMVENSDRLIIEGVRAGRLQLGMVDSASLEKLDKLKIVMTLPPLPSSVVVFSPVIDPLLTEKIKATMLYMDADPLVAGASGRGAEFSFYREWKKETEEILRAMADSFVLRR